MDHYRSEIKGECSRRSVERIALSSAAQFTVVPVFFPPSHGAADESGRGTDAGCSTARGVGIGLAEGTPGVRSYVRKLLRATIEELTYPLGIEPPSSLLDTHLLQRLEVPLWPAQIRVELRDGLAFGAPALRFRSSSC